MKNLKKEKNMNGNEIRDKLIKVLEKDFVINKERNYKSANINPLDLIIGDVKTLDIIGFEVKGDTDNVNNFKSQIDSYLFSCNKVYLVIHKKQKPDWLPNNIGIIRITENEIIEESSAYNREQFDISSGYEMVSLFKENGLNLKEDRIRNLLDLLHSIRQNILFNRFFGELDSNQNSHRFNKFFAFTEKEKQIIMGFDIDFHYKNLKKDILILEDKLNNIKEAMGMMYLNSNQKTLKGE